MAISPYFTNMDVESQLRLHFPMEEQWDTDFSVFLNDVEDTGDNFRLKFRGRVFYIDKITGIVTEPNPLEEEDE